MCQVRSRVRWTVCDLTAPGLAPRLYDGSDEAGPVTGPLRSGSSSQPVTDRSPLGVATANEAPACTQPSPTIARGAVEQGGDGVELGQSGGHHVMPGETTSVGRRSRRLRDAGTPTGAMTVLTRDLLDATPPLSPRSDSRRRGTSRKTGPRPGRSALAGSDKLDLDPGVPGAVTAPPSLSRGRRRNRRRRCRCGDRGSLPARPSSRT